VSTLVVLDSDAVIDVLRIQYGVGARLSQISPENVAIASMTLAELRFGTLKSSNPARNLAELQRLVDTGRVLPFDETAATTHAQLRHALRATPIGPHDLVVAATCLVNDALLVTANVREFSRVPGLRIESWR